MPPAPLRTLVLLRAPFSSPSGDPYASTALRSGHFDAVEHLPVLETTFANLEALARAIEFTERGEYDGVVLTSGRAAEAWAAAAALLPSPSTPSDGDRWTGTTPFFVVGPSTRSALLRAPGRVRPREENVRGAEETGTGEALGRFILAHFAGGAAREAAGEGDETGGGIRRLLYLTGDKNRDVLPSILSSSTSPSITLDALQVYATSPSPAFPSSLAALFERLSPPSEEAATREREIWFALFSPSCAAPLLSALRTPDLLPSSSSSSRLRIRLAAIGPTTRAYVEDDERVPVDAMARKPDADGLLGAIVDALEKDGKGGRLKGSGDLDAHLT
ncbi:hypothetical protein JCM10213_004377 [Rhodosporidiobolus nylandii]